MSVESKQKIRLIVEIVLALLVVVSTVVNFAVSNAKVQFDLDYIKTDIKTIKDSLAILNKTGIEHLRVAEYKIAQLDALQTVVEKMDTRVYRLETKTLESR